MTITIIFTLDYDDRDNFYDLDYSDNNFIYEIQGDQHLLLENTLAPLQLIFLTLATRWMLWSLIAITIIIIIITIIIIIIILFFLVPGSRTVVSTRMLAKSVSSSRRRDVARSAMPVSSLSSGDHFIRVSCFSDD